MKNLQRGFVAPILLAIIGLLVIGSGVYIYKNKKVEAPILPIDTETQTTNQTPPVNTQINSKAGTSDWKTYTNTKYRFEFKYPTKWQVDQQFTTSENIVIHTNDAQNRSLNSLSVFVGPITDANGRKLTLDEYLIFYDYDKNYQNRANRTLNNMSYIRFQNTNSVRYIFVKDFLKYEFVLNYTNEKNITLIDQILSTVKFTVPGATISWKTYTSTQYGFSIQYPTGTQITDVDISGGRSIFFTTSQGTVIVQVVTQAWNNGVLSSPPNCNDTASGTDRTNTNINGINFITFNMSKEMSGMNSPASATEYCAIKNGTAYKLITKVGYAPGSSNGLGLDKNSTLNQMVASFRMN